MGDPFEVRFSLPIALAVYSNLFLSLSLARSVTNAPAAAATAALVSSSHCLSTVWPSACACLSRELVFLGECVCLRVCV